ncbi:hypothetical protein [Cognatilysobacter lacus]|uniref:DUF883 family protein n=1 Tax=Cognatilysobacter lacus TaxID=1643323 RepID=A0A5D8YFR8_9GAMM|nr:hypothetical protein [Lysobacter lacus]TZF80612.1 hypothetical protein FW784_13950 [Lysobacter lacus]
MATTNNGSTEVATGSFRTNIGEAGSSLKQAAVDTGDALKNAAVAAGEELRVGKANLKADLADTALAGIAAAEVAGGAAREQVDALMDKGRDLVDSAAELIRERPLASFGVAFASGWLIAKLARGSSNR